MNVALSKSLFLVPFELIIIVKYFKMANINVAINKNKYNFNKDQSKKETHLIIKEELEIEEEVLQLNSNQNNVCDNFILKIKQIKHYYTIARTAF